MIRPANPYDSYFGGGGVTPPIPPLKFRPWRWHNYSQLIGSSTEEWSLFEMYVFHGKRIRDNERYSQTEEFVLDWKSTEQTNLIIAA